MASKRKRYAVTRAVTLAAIDGKLNNGWVMFWNNNRNGRMSEAKFCCVR